MQKKPLVSILIASYNKEKYVKRCINSCKIQTYDNIEIIFYDDGSKDNSYKIAKNIKGVKSYKNKNRKKLGKFNTYNQINNYNKAFLRSKGKYILLLDSDDFFKKNKVKEIVNYFNRNKNCNIVFDLPIYYYSRNTHLKFWQIPIQIDLGVNTTDGHIVQSATHPIFHIILQPSHQLISTLMTHPINPMELVINPHVNNLD